VKALKEKQAAEAAEGETPAEPETREPFDPDLVPTEAATPNLSEQQSGVREKLSQLGLPDHNAVLGNFKLKVISEIDTLDARALNDFELAVIEELKGKGKGAKS
jgi:hypothetical protein